MRRARRDLSPPERTRRGLVDIVAPKEEGAQEVAELGLKVEGTEGLGRLLDGRVAARSPPSHGLGPCPGRSRRPRPPEPRRREPSKSRSTPARMRMRVDLPAPFGPDEGDLHASFDLEIEFRDHAIGPIGLAQGLELHDGGGRAGGGGEGEVDLLHALGDLDGHDLFELLDPALHEGGFGGLVAEAPDEVLELG